MLLKEDSINVSFLNNPPRFLFFTDKGGVGKTSLSCASAVALVQQGKETLIVSTDPASNLGQVLGISLNSHPAAVTDCIRNPSIRWSRPSWPKKAFRSKVIPPKVAVITLWKMKQNKESLCNK